MSNIYQEIFDSQQNYFITYIKNFHSQKNMNKFSSLRLSYINSITDVNLNFIIIIFVSIVFL